MKKRCLIVSGGDYCRIDDYSERDFVIACDRGYDYCLKDGIVPELVMGDFDSYSGVSIPVKTERFKVEKDDTDTMLAVKKALELGYQHLSIRCALGGRLDHLIANIQSLSYIAMHGADADITDSNNILFPMLPGSLLLRRKKGWSLSVFSLSDECRGVSLRGVKYPLENAKLSSGFPLGVSNDWAAAEAEIELQSGLMLIVESRL